MRNYRVSEEPADSIFKVEQPSIRGSEPMNTRSYFPEIWPWSSSSPRAVPWTINKIINTWWPTQGSAENMSTGQENAWWQTCYERALDEEHKEEDSEKSVIFIVNPPWEPQISLHNTRLPVRNKHIHVVYIYIYIHTHTHTYMYIRSLLARTTMEYSWDVKTLFQSSTSPERNLKVAP
jgi:hypothetical protein